ncbi:invasion associated locus B family protein [Solirhodobacter olei]|uniref:invasion associated locus B family protein n=1 Tax=Solirhodobacter olei TaxID=2493082 RepID=UPI003BA99F4C
MLLVIACSYATSTWAQNVPHAEKRIKIETDWSVFYIAAPKPNCWGVSAPKRSLTTRGGKPVKVNRGDILLFVNFRDGGDPKGGISFTGGYPFAPNSPPIMDIGGRKYPFITKGQWAWPRVPASQSGLLDALKQGSDATITALSTHGTETRDTFSLAGFTAARDDARQRCAAK